MRLSRVVLLGVFLVAQTTLASEKIQCWFKECDAGPKGATCTATLIRAHLFNKQDLEVSCSNGFNLHDTCSVQIERDGGELTVGVCKKDVAVLRIDDGPTNEGATRDGNRDAELTISYGNGMLGAMRLEGQCR